MTTPRPAAPPLPRTEAGRAMLAELGSRFSTVVTSSAVPLILAIEAEAAAEAAQREARVRAALAEASDAWQRANGVALINSDNGSVRLDGDTWDHLSDAMARASRFRA